jgi:hypothetical protein
MRKLAAVVALMLCVSTVSVLADAAVGVKVGTLGIGVEGTVGLDEKFNLRVGGNFASVDLSDMIDDDDLDEDSVVSAEDIQLELDLETLAAMLDWHVWGGGFRLTAGGMLNNNEMTVSADTDEKVEIGDSSYSVDALAGSVSFTQVAPYFGIGYGDAIDEDGHFTFAFDLGVMLQGNPEVEITATASDPTLQAALNADIASEIEEIEDDTEGLSLYPVISIGLAYRF